MTNNEKAAIAYLKANKPKKIRKTNDTKVATTYLKSNTLPRKLHNCKYRKFGPQILNLLNKNWKISSIAKNLNISHGTVKRATRANGIDIDGRIKSGKRKQKKERNERIYKLLLQGKKYGYISEKMNVTRQRVYQVAQTYNFSRWEESRKKHKDIITNIQKDINSGLSYQEIVHKHNLTKNEKSQLRRWGLSESLYNHYQNKRNQNIINKYKSGETALQIITSKDKIINDPKGVKTINQVYSICTKQGIYKYPKVGRRTDGRSFESVKILKLIKDLREEKEFSFDAITNYLNAKNYKTICGKVFTSPNVRCKYFDAIKEGL